MNDTTCGQGIAITIGWNKIILTGEHHKIHFCLKTILEYQIIYETRMYNDLEMTGMFIAGAGCYKGSAYVIDQIVDYFRLATYKKKSKWFGRFRINVQSNGLLFDNEDFQRFLRKNKNLVSVGITIDGTKEKHDLQRVFPNGGGSYDIVERNYRKAMQQGVVGGTKVTFGREDLKYLKESIVHLWSMGIEDVPANVVYEDVWKEGDDVVYQDQLIALADYVVDNALWDRYNTSFFYDNLGFKITDEMLMHAVCGTGRMYCVDAKGDLYNCVRFMEYSLNGKPSKKIEIYGFVGANGAGKTTLIRILAGFSRQTDGTLELFGEADPKKLYIQRRRINGIIEKPAIYPHLSAGDNLEICRKQRGIKGKECIAEILREVGLSDTGSKKAKNFSLGMRQRLGIAMALLGGSEFLFLDEPVNGLDPEGMVNLRELLKRINQERGITILISSHLLSELHQLATCYGFIHNGKMLEQITSEELNKKCRKYLYIKVDQAEKAQTILRTIFQLQNLEILSDDGIKVYDVPKELDIRKINRALVLEGVNIETMAVKSDELDQYYLSLIGGKK